MQALATKKSDPTLTIDLTDPTYRDLSRSAGRIGKLLTTATVRSDPNLAGSLDDFLGAVYALILAKQYDFTDRAGPIDIAAVEKRAAQIKAGRVRTNGKWIAGFYFNNALFRTAAAQHRILKIIVGRNDGVPKLRLAAGGLYRKWTQAEWAHGNLDKVHDQVNELKHQPRGTHDARTVGYADALAAVRELLNVIEAWPAAKVISTSTP
ncbi:MAG: hypothetical protein ACRD2H_10235 [Terriglobales bacterium]